MSYDLRVLVSVCPSEHLVDFWTDLKSSEIFPNLPKSSQIFPTLNKKNNKYFTFFLPKITNNDTYKYKHLGRDISRLIKKYDFWSNYRNS